MSSKYERGSLKTLVENHAASKRRDILGHFLGFAFFAFGVWVIFDGFNLHASRSVIGDLAPIEIGLGLLFAVTGMGLVKRYAFALWILGVWTVCLMMFVLYDLVLWIEHPQTGMSFDWPSGYLAIFVSIFPFVYFFLHRQQFKRPRTHSSEPHESHTG